MDIKARDDTMRRIQDTVAALQTQVAISRELRDISQNLRQDNADVGEFLRETLLASSASKNVWWINENPRHKKEREGQECGRGYQQSR